MLIYRKNFTLETNIIDFDLEATNGWTPDCSQKQDFDPAFICGSSRVYPDGDYVCSINIGEDEIASTGILTADSVRSAKKSCEVWMEEKGEIIRGAVIAALGARP